jgi:NADPH:quinone reductase-like Zn-dependent oxidoreductase
MKELIEAGKVAPVIDRRYPLREIGEAFRYYEHGRPSGRVVVTVQHNT